MYDYNLAILFDYFVDYELLKMLRIFQTNTFYRLPVLNGILDKSLYKWNLAWF